jgi:predicted dehydrogenase
LSAALDDERVEAVVLSTPASTHATLAAQAFDAGRHVMVEKPLANTIEDAEDLVARARAAERTLMVGHTFLYSPPVERLREWIAKGELGAIQYLYSQRLSLGRIRRDCNALWNFAPHDIAIMMYVLGERPVEVTAKGFSFIEPGIEDVVFASLTFDSGIGANLHVSWIDPRKTRLMTVVGDEKMAIYNDVSVDQPLWMVDAGVARNKDLGEYISMGDFQWRTRAGDIVIPRIAMTEPLLNEITAFGDACQTGADPIASGRHGVDVVRVLTAIDESARSGGRPVEVAW